ncbi:MAG: hypothetical protein ABIF40_01250 [archaeon]
MGLEKVTIYGKRIADKQTHYESYTFVGSERATVIIRGDIAEDFYKKYGNPMTAYVQLEIQVDFIQNFQRVKECQDPFQSPMYQIGTIDSLDDIVIITDQKDIK